MNKSDIYTVEEFINAFQPSKDKIEETITLLLHHAEQLLVLAAAFIQDGGHYEEHRDEANDMLETASVKTERAIQSILVAEGILECSFLSHGGTPERLHKTMLHLKEKMKELGVEESYEPEAIHFAVSPSKYFGIEDFEEFPVVYFSGE